MTDEQQSGPEFTRYKKMLEDKRRARQSLVQGAAAGLAAVMAAAVLWALVTYYTGYQIGYMSLGVGLLVGMAVQLAGRGIDPIFGVVGGALSLLGCLLGNFLAVSAMAADHLELSFLEVLTFLDLQNSFALMVETFDLFDLLFYGIAVWIGYGASFSAVSADDVKEFRDSGAA